MPKKALELEFVVTIGVGMFPFDMLRYDHCVPATERDSSVMGNTDYIAERMVILKRYRDLPGYWTPARWKSFGWPLIVQADHDLKTAGWPDVLGKIHPFRSLGDAQRAVHELFPKMS